jgi:preprotein translocase subunit SecA
MDQQRHQIYSARQKVLEAKGTKEMVLEMLERAVTRTSQSNFFQDAEGFRGWFQKTFGFEIEPGIAADAVAKDGNVQPVLDLVSQAYEKREAELTSDILRQLERYILLNAIDGRWKDHLHAIDALKAGIGLRGYGQVDPKTEYKREGFQLFEQLLQAIEDEVTSLILRIKISRPEERTGESAAKSAAAVPQPKGIEPSAAAVARARAAAVRARPAQFVPASRAFDVAKRQQMLAQMQQKAQPQAQTPQPGPDSAVPPAGETNGNAAPAQHAPAAGAARGPAPKPAAQRAHVPAVGRNDPCPCGSGQKYKKCHGKGG